MKILIVLLLLFYTSTIFTQETPTRPIRPEISGMWYDPLQYGHGLNLEVLGDGRIAGFWYLYDTEGNPFWLLLQGDNTPTDKIVGQLVDGPEVLLTAYYYSGMKMPIFDPRDNEREVWGYVSIAVSGCHNLVITMHHGEFDPEGGNQMGLGQMYTRLTMIAGLECIDEVGNPIVPRKFSLLDGDWNFKNDGVLIHNGVFHVEPDGTVIVPGHEYYCGWEGSLYIDEEVGEHGAIFLNKPEGDCPATGADMELWSGEYHPRDFVYCPYREWGEDHPDYHNCGPWGEFMRFKRCSPGPIPDCQGEWELILWRG